MRHPFCVGNWRAHCQKYNHTRNDAKGSTLITSFFRPARAISSTVVPPSSSLSSSPGSELNAVVVTKAFTPMRCHGAVPVRINDVQLELLNLLPTYGHRNKLEGIKVVKTSASDRPQVHSDDCLGVLTASNRAGNKNFPSCCKNVGHSQPMDIKLMLSILFQSTSNIMLFLVVSYSYRQDAATSEVAGAFETCSQHVKYYLGL